MMRLAYSLILVSLISADAYSQSLGGQNTTITFGRNVTGSSFDSGAVWQKVEVDNATLASAGNIGGSQALNSISTSGNQGITVQKASGQTLAMGQIGSWNNSQAANYIEGTGALGTYQSTNFNAIGIAGTGIWTGDQAVNKVDLKP